MAKEFPYESFMRHHMGENWRYLPEPDIHGAWGIAIIKSVLDGVPLDPESIANHLGVMKWKIQTAFRGLNLNGAFMNNRLEKDRKDLESNDVHAWGYYAGYASGQTGL